MSQVYPCQSEVDSRSPENLALQQLRKSSKIGLYDPAEADLVLFCNSWSAGFLGERLYMPRL